jgi:hypothetical protein
MTKLRIGRRVAEAVAAVEASLCVGADCVISAELKVN